MLNKIIIIGTSAGGLGQIQKIISALPLLKNSTIIIAQHMAVEFLPSFVKRLQESTENVISIAKDNEILKNEYIYFCNADTEVKKRGSDLSFVCKASS